MCSQMRFPFHLVVLQFLFDLIRFMFVLTMFYCLGWINYNQPTNQQTNKQTSHIKFYICTLANCTVFFQACLIHKYSLSFWCILDNSFLLKIEYLLLWLLFLSGIIYYFNNSVTDIYGYAAKTNIVSIFIQVSHFGLLIQIVQGNHRAIETESWW